MGAARRRHAGPPLVQHAAGRAVPSNGPWLDVVEIRSFEEFYVSEWGSMVGLAFTRTGSREAAEELAQEAMLRAYREWGRVSSYDRPATWVRRVLLNLAASRWRRHTSAARAMLRLHPRDESVELSASAVVVWDAVRRLPRRQAEVISLHYGSDVSVDEIAETLGCAPGTVRTHLIRGRAALAIALDEDEP